MIDIHKSQMISNNNTYVSICNVYDRETGHRAEPINPQTWSQGMLSALL